MLHSTLPKNCRAVFAALLGVVSAASGSNWCPSSSDNVITCSNCTRTLTCNYTGKITITGDNVELDGNSYSILNSPGVGLEINGSADVFNLNVYNSASHGIEFSNTTTSASKYGNLNNVTVMDAGNSGIVNSSSNSNRPFEVYLSSTTVMFSQNYGVLAAHSQSASSASTDIFNSSLHGNGLEGVNSYFGQGMYQAGNYYSSNHSGARIINLSGGYITMNTASNNSNIGFYLENFYPDATIGVNSNSGYGNGSSDCYAAGGSNLDFYYNSFVTHTRCN